MGVRYQGCCMCLCKIACFCAFLCFFNTFKWPAEKHTFSELRNNVIKHISAITPFSYTPFCAPPPLQESASHWRCWEGSVRSCTALQVLVTSRCLLGIYACSRPPPSLGDGQIRFRRARVQTPNSVSFFGPHRVPERESSVSSFHLIICVL